MLHTLLPLLKVKVESLEDFIFAVSEVQYKTTIKIRPIVLEQGGIVDRYVYVLRFTAKAKNEPKLFFEEKISEHTGSEDYQRMYGEENRLIIMSRERKFQLETKLCYTKIKLDELAYKESVKFKLTKFLR